MPECTSGRERSPRTGHASRESESWRTNCVSGIRGNPSRKERVIVVSPHQAADSRTDRDEGFQRETHFCGSSFLTDIPDVRLQQQVDRVQGIRRRTWSVRGTYAGVRGTYAERMQDVRRYTASTRTISLTVFFLRFSRRFCPSLRGFLRFLRFSDCPRVAASPPGWHSLDGNLPICAVRGLGSQFLRAVSSSIGSEVRSELPGPSQRVRLVRKQPVPPPRQPFVLN